MLKFTKTILLLFYFSSPLFSIFLFVIAISSNSIEFITPIRYIAAITGLIAYVWLTYSFILMARPKILDQIFGMDTVRKFHKNMSIISLALSLVHGLILFIMFSAQEHNKLAFRSGVLAFSFMLLLMFLGGLFLIQSILIKIKGFKNLKNYFGSRYNLHLSIHNITIIATSVLLAHLMLSTSTTYSITLRLTYLIHYTLAFSFWFYHKIIRSIRTKRHSYTISEIKKENNEIWTLKLIPKKNRKLIQYKPGQYCYLTISSLGKESHPFSFSSNPLEKDFLTISIKKCGDYTSDIDKVNIGDIAYIDGPYGIFNHLDKKGDELVFIAGGIGITPFLSMLYYIKEKNRNSKISLIWGVRTQNDIIFKSEIEQFKKEIPNLSVAYILSEDNSWTKDCGFIDREKLEKYGSCDYPDNEEQYKHYFVCGPKLMTDLVLNTLRKMSVSKMNIHSEQFNF